MYDGDKFDSGVTVICPNSKVDLPYIWVYCKSAEFETALRAVDSKISITTSTVLKVEFPRALCQKIAGEQYPEGLPEPESNDPTRWLFHGEPGRVHELAGGCDLDDWLRNGFFEQHCQLFHQRPFIWHIWDGRKRDGFGALVNYHKLAEGGADDRLAAALELQKRLEAILEGEPPYDIFVRWNPLHEQAIGWEPDINDGVRMNIRSFLASDLPGGKKGAGILRAKPNIKWTKDRGKEPERPKADYPWFWGWDEKTENFAGGNTFDGNRWNDCHYANETKQAAREAGKKDG